MKAKNYLLSAIALLLSFAVISCSEEQSSDVMLPDSSLAAAMDESDVLAVQRQALTSLYEATGGTGWYHSDNWNTNAPLSEWYGVSMEGDYVTAIELPGNNLTGHLPQDLVKLEKIQSIILSGNKIGGEIPAAWGAGASTRADAGDYDEDSFEDGVEEDFDDSDANYDLDAVLAQLSASADDDEEENEGDDATTPFASSLAVLDLSDNLITGTIPEELGNLNKLRSLSISNNLMKGEISMAVQQSAMWQNLIEVPTLEQKQNNVLTIASSSDGKATAVRLDKTSLTLPVGKKYTFTPTIVPSNADIKEIKWKTGDKTIVAINSKGVIQGVKAGTAKVAVYVYNQDGTKVSATCKVTVTEDIPATAVKLNKTSVSLNVGETFTFTSTITPTNATPKEIKWKSGDESIVAINSKGVIKGVKAGTAKVAVYVYNEDGTKVSATCVVTVKDPVVPATAVKLNKTSVALEVGETFRFTSTITPTNATPKEIKWKSGDESIVAINSKGVIKGVKAGTAKVAVYVYNEDGTKVSATCVVTVKDPVVPATAVGLNKTSVTLNVGETFRFTSTITPTNATPKEIKWKSGDESIVAVNNNGVIKGVKAGTANVAVYVYNEDGTKVTAKCKVTVNANSTTGDIEDFNESNHDW